MARIPQDELNRLKREIDLVELITSSGVKLERRGADLMGLCPFHEDHEPSLVVTPSKNLWHCLGACDAGGSVVDWVMKSQGVSFRHAAEILRKGVRLETVAAVKHTSIPRLPLPITDDAAGRALLAQVVDYYHETLLDEPEAQAYLKMRGIFDSGAVDAFKIGYANRTLGLRLPPKHRAAGAKLRTRLTDVGLVRTSGHEHFNGSIAIPVFDGSGQVVEIYGRKITPNLRSGTPKHLYLPGPHRGVWNLEALRSSKEIILCESLIDALTFWCAGFQNVTSSFGTNGFTDEIFEGFMAYGIKRALIAYDRDDAGDAAAEKLAERLGSEGISCFRVLFPHHMDANEYALKVTPAAQSLGVVLRAAQYIAGPLASLGNQQPADPANASLVAGAGPSPPLAAGSEPEPLAKPEEMPASPAPRIPKPEPGAPAPAPPARTTENERWTTGAPASPVPPPPRPDIPAEVSDHQVVLRLGDRYWRVRGFSKNLSFELMRVNLFVSLSGGDDRFHQDTFDLYSAKQRQGFTRHAAVELGATEALVKKDLGQVLLKLERLQEEAIRSELEAKAETPTMTAAERENALKLLKEPSLLDRIAGDFERCGVVGERTNKLVAYLAAVSRKLAKPLAVMVQSSSAAGKSALMNAVLALVPSEELVAYSAMTGQSLFYMGSSDLKHKVLAIAEEEGAEKASYALKLLQSEGELTIASTGKDPVTGRLTTHEYHVEGPTAILTTTTAVDLDEELLNRCIVLTVDESREQTRAIHRRQREEETLEGYLGRIEREEILKLHKNAQRLLRPLAVVNPFARQLTFLDAKTRTRRDHLKYLALIRAITLVHQHQRPLKTRKYRGKPRPYIEVELSDISAANQLAAEVLGRTLDELSPQTRRFLLDLDAMVAEACEARGVDRPDLHFTARQVRERTGWGATQVKVHLKRLADMEYLLTHRACRGQGFVYELLYDGEGQEGASFLMGLIDVEHMKKQHYDEERSASNGGWSEAESDRSGGGRPLVGPWSGGGRSTENGEKANEQRHSEAEMGENGENALIRGEITTPSYRNAGRSRSEEESPEKKPEKKLEKEEETTKSEEKSTEEGPGPEPLPETGAAHGGRLS